MSIRVRLQDPGSRRKKILTSRKTAVFIWKLKLLCRGSCAGSALLRSPAGTLLLGVFAFARLAQGQSVLAPPPVFSATPPAMQEFQTNRLGSVLPPETAGAAQDRPLLEWGPLNLRPHMLYRFLYGNGIQSSPGEQQVTAINEFSPGLLLGLGRHFTLDYTPTWRVYSNNKFEDTLDHDVELTGGTTYEDWVLGLSQSYNSISVPLAQTGTQTPQETYLTSLSASYRFNSKLSTDLAVEQTFASAEKFASYREWVTMNWLNYQLWPRLDAGVGLGFGYDDVEASPDMTFERLQGRIIWRATDKTSLQVRGGAEDRQFLDGGAEDLLNPIAGASLEYHPAEATFLSLNVDRIVSVSYFDSQVTETTTFSANVSQRLLKRLNLSAGGGFAKSKYVASAAGVSADRDDDYFVLNARLSCAIRKRTTVALFYMYSENSSKDSTFNFSSSQGGFELRYWY